MGLAGLQPRLRMCNTLWPLPLKAQGSLPEPARKRAGLRGALSRCGPSGGGRRGRMGGRQLRGPYAAPERGAGPAASEPGKAGR